eukprot:1000915-Prorocentrum_minimum.AAC.3
MSLRFTGPPVPITARALSTPQTSSLPRPLACESIDRFVDVVHGSRYMLPSLLRLDHAAGICSPPSCDWTTLQAYAPPSCDWTTPQVYRSVLLTSPRRRPPRAPRLRTWRCPAPPGGSPSSHWPSPARPAAAAPRRRRRPPRPAAAAPHWPPAPGQRGPPPARRSSTPPPRRAPSAGPPSVCTRGGGCNKSFTTVSISLSRFSSMNVVLRLLRGAESTLAVFGTGGPVKRRAVIPVSCFSRVRTNYRIRTRSHLVETVGALLD